MASAGANPPVVPQFGPDLSSTNAPTGQSDTPKAPLDEAASGDSPTADVPVNQSSPDEDPTPAIPEIAAADNAGEDNAAEDNAGEDYAGEDKLGEDKLGEDEEEADEDDDAEPEHVEPLELIVEPSIDEELKTDWYILKVQVNREDSIRDALQRRVKVEGYDRFFKEIVVPTEDVAEFTKTGKRRVVKRKLYPGYIMVNMHINDETWFLVRETPGIGDFTGSAGKPTPMLQRDVERILNIGKADDGIDTHVKTAIPFKQGDRVRVKDGYFQNFEGDVESVDEANGRVTVMINIFGRSTPVELEHWQIEAM